MIPFHYPYYASTAPIYPHAPLPTSYSPLCFEGWQVHDPAQITRPQKSGSLAFTGHWQAQAPPVQLHLCNKLGHGNPQKMCNVAELKFYCLEQGSSKRGGEPLQRNSTAGAFGDPKVHGPSSRGGGGGALGFGRQLPPQLTVGRRPLGGRVLGGAAGRAVPRGGGGG